MKLLQQLISISHSSIEEAAAKQHHDFGRAKSDYWSDEDKAKVAAAPEKPGFRKTLNPRTGEVNYVKLRPGESVKEAADHEEYSTSAEFDDDMDDIEKHLAAVQEIVESNRWKKHMYDTDQNFDASARKHSDRALAQLQLARKAFDALYNHMIEAA